MGRDIGVLIRDRKTKKILVDSFKDYDDFVCGRDDATNYISMMCDHPADSREGDEDLMDELYAVPDYCDISEEGKFSEIKQELQRYLAKEKKETQKIKDELEDLREARRHAPDYDAFCSFGTALTYIYNELEEAEYSRAGHLIDMLNTMKERFDRLKGNDDVELLIYCSE